MQHLYHRPCTDFLAANELQSDKFVTIGSHFSVIWVVHVTQQQCNFTTVKYIST